MSFFSFYSLSSKIRIFLCQFLWIFLILGWHNDGRNSPLCVGWGERKKYPTGMRFSAVVFCKSQQCYKRCSFDWFFCLLFIFFINLFCRWGEGMQFYVGKQPQGERNTRNLVVTFFLVVLIECFFVLVWSGPGFVWKSFSYFRGLWGSKKRDDNSHVGVADTFFCITCTIQLLYCIIGFFHSGLLYWNREPWKGIRTGVSYFLATLLILLYIFLYYRFLAWYV